MDMPAAEWPSKSHDRHRTPDSSGRHARSNHAPGSPSSETFAYQVAHSSDSPFVPSLPPSPAMDDLVRGRGALYRRARASLPHVASGAGSPSEIPDDTLSQSSSADVEQALTQCM